ncbi:MAG: hypothetical protein K2O01_05995 [Bacteroidales bacterium]|nr:hypothetical protein [Bacteroidales bacterium]
MNWIRIAIRVIQVVALAFLAACANIAGAPGGGPKDVLPPALLVSQPPQAALDFQGGVVTMEFDEFVELRDQDKIYASPVLKRTNYSYMLKKVRIEIEDTLRPDYTYTIRFGQSLVDLHEANPIPDYHYVFSTGSVIDSMFLEGRIVKAVDYTPEDRVRLLFYAHRPDSFPFDEEPDYVSIADKEGRFRVIHMKEGCYYVYGVMDENQDYRIDPVTEMMAYTDTCVRARKMVPVAVSPPADSLALADSLAQVAEAAEALADSLAWVAAYASYDDAGTDTSAGAAAVWREARDDLARADAMADGLAAATWRDSLPDSDPALELYLYRDYLPAFFLKEVSYKQRSQMEFAFYYPIDSIEASTFIEITDSTETELAMPSEWQWAADRRSAVVYFPNHTMGQCDVILQVSGNRDTASVYLADAVRSRTDTVKLQLAVSGSKLLVADTLRFKANFPTFRGDTDRVTVWRFVETERPVTDTVWLCADTSMEQADTSSTVAALPPSPSDTAFRLVDTVRLFTDTLVQPFGITQIDAWTWAVSTKQETGGQYALFLQDSAVFDFFGRPNDTTVLTWQIIEPEEGGDLALDLQGLEPGAVYVLQLVQGNENIVQEVRVTDAGTVEFLALKPAQYTFRLFKDDNDNGRWDEGDYVARRQPEKHWYYHKTLRVEADWRIEDIWRIE